MTRREVLVAALALGGVALLTASGVAFAANRERPPHFDEPPATLNQPEKLMFMSKDDYIAKHGQAAWDQQLLRAKGLADAVNRKKSS